MSKFALAVIIIVVLLVCLLVLSSITLTGGVQPQVTPTPLGVYVELFGVSRNGFKDTASLE